MRRPPGLPSPAFALAALALSLLALLAAPSSAQEPAGNEMCQRCGHVFVNGERYVTISNRGPARPFCVACTRCERCGRQGGFVPRRGQAALCEACLQAKVSEDASAAATAASASASAAAVAAKEEERKSARSPLWIGVPVVVLGLGLVVFAMRGGKE